MTARRDPGPPNADQDMRRSARITVAEQVPRHYVLTVLLQLGLATEEPEPTARRSTTHLGTNRPRPTRRIA